MEIRKKLQGGSHACFCHSWLEQRAVILICDFGNDKLKKLISQKIRIKKAHILNIKFLLRVN